MKLKRSLSEYVRRYICFTISLFIMALGVAISTKSDLGTSPVSCVPYVLSLGLPLSMGVTTIIWNAVFLLVQIIFQRRDFMPFQVLQIATISVFGYFTDFALALVSWINVDTYIMRWVLCIISSMVIAIGVSLEVKSDVLMLAGEGTMTVISNKFGIEFGKVKTGFDCTQMLIGVALSLLMFGKLQGVREGTVAAAILVGVFVRFIYKNFGFILVWLKLDKPHQSRIDDIKSADA